jgi:Trypsin-like peptidase domain
MAIAQASVAAAYLPLHATTHLGLDTQDGAAVVIAPGIAATNAHNANMVDPKDVIGVRQDFDLMFFRTSRTAAPQTGDPAVGQSVIAYGQGGRAELRVARGLVREIHACAGCGPASAYFVFAGNAGPGFSGGPVLDAAGRLVGITFGYKDQSRVRLIYAYAMSRVMTELSALQNQSN